MLLHPRARRLITSVDPTAAVAFCSAVVLLAIGGWQILQAREHALAEAEHNVVILSRALAQQAGRTIEAVDLSLVDAVDRVEGGQDMVRLTDWLRQRSPMLAQVRNLVVVGADGQWLADSAPPHVLTTSADRSYLAWHRDHADRGLHIDHLLVGRTTGKPGLPLSRRFDGPNGSFGGVVVATLNPEFFEGFYPSVATGAQGTVGLWAGDGRSLFRYPARPEAFGDVVSANAARAFAMGASTSLSASPFDGVERRIAFQRVEGLPLVVSASISTADALANWSRSAATELVVLVAAAIAVILLGLGLQIRSHRMAALEAGSRVMDERYRLLTENASDLITLRPSLLSRPSYVSPSCRQLLGWEQDELATLQDTTHPDDIAPLTARFEGLTPANPRATSHHRVRHKAGHYVFVEAVMTLTADGVLTAIRDVSARRAAERRLAESEARFRSLAEASSDMIQQLDLSGQRLYVSPASFEIFGRGLAEMVGTHPSDFIIGEDAARVGQLIADLVDGRRDQARSVHQIRHADGHGVYVETLFRLVRDGVTGAPREIVSSLRDITEREMLQRQHAEANRRLRMAEEMAHLGHWRIELPSGRLTWSDEVFRIHGRDPAGFEPTLEQAVASYHPDDRAEVKRLVTAAMRSREPFVFCLRIVRPDGDRRDVLSRGLCEVGADGTIAAVFGTVMDVTELRAAERATAASEARYRLLADHTTDMITQMDLDGRRLFVSPGSRDLLGYRPDELVGTSSLGMIHPDDAQAVSDVLGDLAAGRRTSAVNVNRLRHKDGRWIWVEASLRPLGNTAGTVEGFVAAIRDITDRTRALDALQASEVRYRVLAEATTDVITQLDLSMKRQYVSPACRHLLGFEPEEMLGLRPSTSIHPDEAGAVRALAAKLIAGEIASDRLVTTYRTLHKKGHWVWVEAGMNLTRNPKDGTPVSLICSLRDVTERQEAAQQMERAKAAAEHAVRIKTDFVANMSHELRTPLTGILGVHDLLRRDPTLGAAQKRLVDLASDAGATLLAIVNDVLDFSKIEAEQLVIEAVPFDLDDLVASCSGLAGEGLAGKPIEIRTHRHEALPRWVIGDPTRLRQVLLNLLTNAVKFTERGHIDVDLAYDAERGRLRVDVLDTGIGVPADRRHTLFERFTQADSSTTRRYGGTGLGLAICRRLVELMGGRIGIETSMETGAHFWFDLPIPVHHGIPRPGEVVADVGRAARLHHLLLAEDNAINVEIIARTLETRGFSVTAVPDGAAAVAAVAADPARFSLVLMDLQMPVMDGLSAAAEIRRGEKAAGAPPLPIIGLTANATVEDAARCRAAGMNAHVAKPVVWQSLFATIDALLAANHAEALAATGRDGETPDLDAATLEDLAAIIGRNRLADILNRFAAELPTHMGSIASGGAEAVAERAHMLTSMAGQLGFLSLSRCASEVERESGLGSAAHLLPDLHAAAERAAAAVTASPYARAG